MFDPNEIDTESFPLLAEYSVRKYQKNQCNAGNVIEYTVKTV